MVTAAAGLWAAIGAAYLIAAIDGTAIAGWGQVLIGIAAVIAALAGLRNGSRIKAVEGKADVAAGKANVAAGKAAEAAKDSATVVRTLGPENGKTLQQLLSETHAAVERIEEIHEYQRDRNHKIINSLGTVQGSMPVLLAAVERNTEATNRLLTRLDQVDQDKETP